MMFCNHAVSLEDFKVLASSNSEFHLKIKESVLISRDSQSKKNEKSWINALPLEYFICTWLGN